MTNVIDVTKLSVNRGDIVFIRTQDGGGDGVAGDVYRELYRVLGHGEFVVMVAGPHDLVEVLPAKSTPVVSSLTERLKQLEQVVEELRQLRHAPPP